MLASRQAVAWPERRGQAPPSHGRAEVTSMKLCDTTAQLPPSPGSRRRRSRAFCITGWMSALATTTTRCRMSLAIWKGGCLIGSSTVRLGGLQHCFAAIPLPDLRNEPERGDGWVRFVQTGGGRAGLPMPRKVRRRPYVQWNSPLVWTTLSLTMHADGRAEPTLAGASKFPRQWVYNRVGRLCFKSGLTDWRG